jgi:hypothetical protein
VADKLAGREAGVEVPQAEGLVPRRRERELAVRRDDDVRDKVVVAVEDLLGEAERRLVARELPDDDGLVCGSATFRFAAKFFRPDSPRDEVRIMSGFSDEVAMAVTQPEWPAREPLNARGSPILICFLVVVVSRTTRREVVVHSLACCKPRYLGGADKLAVAGATRGNGARTSAVLTAHVNFGVHHSRERWRRFLERQVAD